MEQKIKGILFLSSLENEMKKKKKKKKKQIERMPSPNEMEYKQTDRQTGGSRDIFLVANRSLCREKKEKTEEKEVVGKK